MADELQDDWDDCFMRGIKKERTRIVKIIHRYLSEDYLLEGQFEKMLKEIEGVKE